MGGWADAFRALEVTFGFFWGALGDRGHKGKALYYLQIPIEKTHGTLPIGWHMRQAPT